MLSFGIISSSAASSAGLTSWSQFAPTGRDYRSIAFAPSGTAAGFTGDSGGSVIAYYASNVETALSSAVSLTPASTAISYVNDAFYGLAAGNRRFIRRSTTGTSWTTVLNIAQTGDVINAIAYGNGLYVAPVANDNDVYTSTDGVTWTEKSSVIASSNWTEATWNGSVYGVYVSASTSYYTSTNGTTWTSRTLPATRVSGVAWDENNTLMYLALGGVCYTSTTGTSWSIAGTAGITGRLRYGAGLWVVFNESGGLFTSRYSGDNGATWGTTTFATGGTAGVAYDMAFNPANNSFYIINDAGSTTDIYKATVTS